MIENGFENPRPLTLFFDFVGMQRGERFDVGS